MSNFWDVQSTTSSRLTVGEHKLTLVTKKLHGGVLRMELWGETDYRDPTKTSGQRYICGVDVAPDKEKAIQTLLADFQTFLDDCGYTTDTTTDDADKNG